MTDIKIIRGPLDDVKKRLSSYKSLYVVYDKNVKDLVSGLGLDAKGLMEIEASEANKNLLTVQSIDRWLMELDADRKAFILGVGGGITTDIVGFAASIYKRGVRFGFLPTTLLSQVDASIGGKNGVNLDSFKNMIGVIRQPEMTFICTEALRSLPYNELLSGVAEMLKTFIIDNRDEHYEKTISIFKKIKDSIDKSAVIDSLYPDIQDGIAAAAEIKAGIAGRDPNELGERKLLNLGHTFAHAIEKKSNEKIAHGAAVGIGIILAARLSEAVGLAEEGLAVRIKEDFEKAGLSTKCPYKITDLGEAMKKDKKAEGEIIHFVLPLAIGKVEIHDLTVEEAIVKLV